MGEKEGKNDGGEKKAEGGAVTVVLKVNMHCADCAKKVMRAVCLFEGVESVSTDNENSMLTVVGKLDPWKLREKVEQKTHKKVVLISPTEALKVEKKSDGKLKEEKKPDEKPKEEKKPDEKPKEEKKPDEKPKEVKIVEEKPKPPVASILVLRIRLHCDGCIQKIRKAILKIKGVEDVTFDPQNDLVALKGTMDVNALPSYLETKFKKKVEVVPLPKQEEGGGGKDKSIVGGEGGGDKKGGEGVEDKKDRGGDRGKEKKIDDSREKKDEKKKEVDSETKVEVNKMEYYGSGGVSSQYYNSDATTHYYASSSGAAMQYFHNGDFHNGGGDPSRAYMPYGYPIDLSPAPQLFSDENPNSCSVM